MSKFLVTDPITPGNQLRQPHDHEAHAATFAVEHLVGVLGYDSLEHFLNANPNHWINVCVSDGALDLEGNEARGNCRTIGRGDDA